jgi:hypothetical protein
MAKALACEINEHRRPIGGRHIALNATCVLAEFRERCV